MSWFGVWGKTRRVFDPIQGLCFDSADLRFFFLVFPDVRGQDSIATAYREYILDSLMIEACRGAYMPALIQEFAACRSV